MTLEHVTTAQQLARISNDTGLQEDVGPGILKSLTVTARRNFSHGFVQGLFARADAGDRLTGLPTPEAPRLIWMSWEQWTGYRFTFSPEVNMKRSAESRWETDSTQYLCANFAAR